MQSKFSDPHAASERRTAHMSRDKRTRVGIAGLGTMGRAIAARLSEHGIAPLVWNRDASKYALLEKSTIAPAEPVQQVDELFSRCDVILLMLPDGAADVVLERGTSAFASRVAQRTLVYMGTTSPEYSAGLARDVENAGGCYAELPVSGSREPARNGQLVGMLAANDTVAGTLVDILAVLCKRVVRCGAAPNAMRMKLAVNMHLIATVTSLAETMNFARRSGLDTLCLQEVLLAGPMASDILRAKSSKLLKRDYATDASVDVILNNSELIAQAAHNTQAACPMTLACVALYQHAAMLGWGDNDMVAVQQAIEDRNQVATTPNALDLAVIRPQRLVTSALRAVA